MMDSFFQFAEVTIQQYGYVGIFVLTTAEQFIFPIPADFFVALGTAAGLLFNKIVILMLIAAVIGSLIGYYLGKWFGHPVVKWLFGQEKLDEGEKFIKKWGVWGVILAGTTPIPFKIVTWTAGIFEMPLHKFLLGVVLGRMPRYVLTAYANTLFFKHQLYAGTEMSALILGAVQGVTEFLPISSSGHLVLMEPFLKLPIAAADLALFDIFLHGGSLLAILLYFWRDWLQVLQEFWTMLKARRLHKNTLASKLALGTIPAIVAGLMFGDVVSGPLRNLTSVAIFFMLVALFFLYVEWKQKGHRSEAVTLKKSLLIGSAQALALIPGVSRAGMTIGVGMLTGLKRDVAARFSFMLGGVAILAANVYALFSIRSGAVMPDLTFTLIGFFTSFAVSFMAMAWLLRFLRRHTLRGFSFYLLIMGIFILSFL